MKFKSITIENCFTYHGTVTFDFHNSEKPITLIIGENGFGKTSFINSVKIALHGISRDLLNIGTQKLTKQDFILGSTQKHFSGLLNRIARSEGINEAKIIVELEDDESIKVERRFTIHSSNYAETLLLFDEEGRLIAENEEAQDIINAKVSPTMAQFFFFDGEKIQTIADFSHDEFTKMLEDVLELDIYDQMAKDARELIRRNIKNEMDEDLVSQVTCKEEELASIKIELSNEKDRLSLEKENLKALESEARELNSRLNRLKSRHQKPLEESQAKLDSLHDEHKYLTSKLKEATFVQLPLLLSKTLYGKVKDDIDQNYRGRVQIDSELLEKKKQELISKLSSDDAEKISKAFDEVFRASNDNQSVSFANPYKIEKQFDALPQIDFPKLLSSLSQIKREIIETESEIEELKQKIALDKKDYQDEFIKSRSLSEKIGKTKALIESIEESINILNNKEKTLHSELARLTIKEHKNALISKKIEALNGIIEVANKLKSKIKREKRKSLEISINEKFHLLKKEGYEADKIILDDDFKINIYDKHGHPMDILSSSSGQKQIIATALIWGISEYIAEEIPMIIDTPLGRLDEKNQTLILQKFYPHASKQVIILPTPSELKHEGFKTLTDVINEIFVLSNAGSATTITKKESLEQYFQHYQPSLPLLEESA